VEDLAKWKNADPVNQQDNQICPPGGDVLETDALIIGFDGDRAIVRAARRSGCAACSVAASCGSGALSRVFSEKDAVFHIPNDFNGRMGERIVLGLAAPVLLRAAAAVYLLPLLAMILAAAGAGLAGWGDGGAALAGLAGLAAGLAIIYLRGRTGPGAARPVFLRRA